jgi:hypothetical protein
MNPLFSIETHTSFTRKKMGRLDWLVLIAHEFGIDDVGDMYLVEKRNIESEVYVLDTPSERFILRGAKAVLEQQVNAQCNFVNIVNTPLLLSLLPHQDGGFTCLFDGRVWFAYKEVLGDVYDGRSIPPENVIVKGVKLLSAMQEITMPKPNSHLMVVKHSPDAWSDMFMKLTDAKRRRELSQLNEYISDDVQELLNTHPDIVICLLERALNLSQAQLEPAVVHNDLQHANTIVKDANVTFIDLEDICMESPGVAIGHCVFKLLRHSVYSGGTSVEDVRTVTLPRLVKEHLSTSLWSLGETELINFASYRIFSDIFKIVTHYLNMDSTLYMYDLDKKICNLFELYLFGKTHDGLTIN